MPHFCDNIILIKENILIFSESFCINYVRIIKFWRVFLSANFCDFFTPSIDISKLTNLKLSESFFFKRYYLQTKLSFSTLYLFLYNNNSTFNSSNQIVLSCLKCLQLNIIITFLTRSLHFCPWYYNCLSGYFIFYEH